MSVLTKENNTELVDTWYVFGAINDEEERIMCLFDAIHNEKSEQQCSGSQV